MKTKDNIQCDKCEKFFIRKYSLKRHIKTIHFGVKDYECECGKKFVSKDQLTRHNISKHTREKPIKCEKGCEKSYSTKMARNYHYKTFHENKRFSCNYLGCNREFSSLRNLRIHCSKPHEESLKSLMEKLKKKQAKIQKLKKKIKKLEGFIMKFIKIFKIMNV